METRSIIPSSPPSSDMTINMQRKGKKVTGKTRPEGRKRDKRKVVIVTSQPPIRDAIQRC
jgi:hypothetical protein